MSNNKKQGKNDMNSGGGNKNKKGKHFCMIIKEIIEFLMNRKNIELNGRHWSIINYLLLEIYGWEGRSEALINQLDMEKGTGIHHGHLVTALNELVAGGIILKKKVPGERCRLFSFNKDLFGRTLATDEPTQVKWQGQVIETISTKGTDLVPFTKGTKSVPDTSTDLVLIEGTDLVPSTSRKLPKLKRNSPPKEGKENIKEISLYKFSEFLKSQPRCMRARWEKYISEILRIHKEDSDLLLLVLQVVHKERTDFSGLKIRSSIIGLFEKTEWNLAKEVFISRLQREKEKQDHKTLLERTRESLLSKADEPIDESKISPLFRKYADKKND